MESKRFFFRCSMDVDFPRSKRQKLSLNNQTVQMLSLSAVPHGSKCCAKIKDTLPFCFFWGVTLHFDHSKSPLDHCFGEYFQVTLSKFKKQQLIREPHK